MLINFFININFFQICGNLAHHTGVSGGDVGGKNGRRGGEGDGRLGEGKGTGEKERKFNLSGMVVLNNMKQ